MFSLGKKLAGLFSKKVDAATLAELEELLITSDISVELAQVLIESVRKSDAPLADLRARLAEIMKPCESRIDLSSKPYSILFTGVNGAGKTTTIGKIATMLPGQKSIVACDTFRVSAAEQLGEWAMAAGARFVEKSGAEPSALAFDGMKMAVDAGDDLVLFDTAGRLASNDSLLAEMAKISRSIGKAREGSPSLTLLVLDGAGGQNSLLQWEKFSAALHIDGVIATKLDGSAKGGFLATLAYKYRTPIYYLGFGESGKDLEEFDALRFAERLVG